MRDLEIRHCRVLVAVHDNGGVGAAARVLGVAQSTVSETLLSLERLLETPVTVRRTGREAMLTTAAEAMLPYARSLIATSEAALAASSHHAKATVRLGTVESISSFLLPGPLHDFRLRWPQVDVRISIGLCEDLRRRVARSELDVALTIEGAGQEDGADIWPMELALVVAPDHDLAQAVASRRDLETKVHLLADSEGAFNGLMRSWLSQSGQPPRLESAGSVDGVKRGVLSGDAVGVLPLYAVADELAGGLLNCVRTDHPLPQIALRLTTSAPPSSNSPLEGLMAEIRGALR